MSVKWISTESGVLQLNKKAEAVFSKLNSRERCNLVSVFGRARQGKSFLMNCLSGQKDTFKISNEKDSCTQGIDLSSKWITLNQFSQIDCIHQNGRADDIKVGFIDAEGQGDRNVTYDAALVCPILLVSKCVIFNWKGDLQKDHILETLGIMTRAAGNVGVEGPADQKKFQHLHIVFRDWQSVDGTSETVRQALFAKENIPDAETRDRIRDEVLRSFISVTVWLLDAPVQTTRELRTKLTLEKTTAEFRGQIRELRQALAEQLSEPTTIGGQVMTGGNIGPFVQQAVNSLNSGNVILPQSAFVNMLRVEIDNLQRAFEAALDKTVEETIGSLSAESTLAGEAEALRQYRDAVTQLLQRFDAERDEAIGSMAGDQINALRQRSDAGLKQFCERAERQFLSEFRVLFTRWLKQHRRAVFSEMDEQCARLQKSPPGLSAEKFEETLDSLLAEFVAKMTADNRYEGEDITEAVEQLKLHFHRHRLELVAANEKAFAISVEQAQSGVRESVQIIHDKIPSLASTLLSDHPLGFTQSDLANALNREYKHELSKLIEQFAARVSEETLGEMLFSACKSLQDRMNATFQSLRHDTAVHCVTQACTNMATTVEELETAGSVGSARLDQLVLDSIRTVSQDLEGWRLVDAGLHEHLVAKPLKDKMNELKHDRVDKMINGWFARMHSMLQEGLKLELQSSPNGYSRQHAKQLVDSKIKSEFVAFSPTCKHLIGLEQLVDKTRDGKVELANGAEQFYEDLLNRAIGDQIRRKFCHVSDRFRVHCEQQGGINVLDRYDAEIEKGASEILRFLPGWQLSHEEVARLVLEPFRRQMIDLKPELERLSEIGRRKHEREASLHNNLLQEAVQSKSLLEEHRRNRVIAENESKFAESSDNDSEGAVSEHETETMMMMMQEREEDTDNDDLVVSTTTKKRKLRDDTSMSTDEEEAPSKKLPSREEQIAKAYKFCSNLSSSSKSTRKSTSRKSLSTPVTVRTVQEQVEAGLQWGEKQSIVIDGERVESAFSVARATAAAAAVVAPSTATTVPAVSSAKKTNKVVVEEAKVRMQQSSEEMKKAAIERARKMQESRKKK